MSKLFTPKFLISAAIVIALVVVLSLFVPRVALPAIEIPAEAMFTIGSFEVTNTLLASWLSMIVLILLSFFATRRMKLVPRGLQNVMEMVVEMLHNMVEQFAHTKWARSFFPIVATFFLYLLVSNWLGILPFFGSVGVLHEAHEGAGYTASAIGGSWYILKGVPAAEGEGYKLAPFLRSAATDVNLPLALAIISVLLTQYFGVRSLGVKYFGKFININFKHGVGSGLIGLFVGIVELVSEIAKIISFTFRLFGNVFAGEVLLGVFAFLIPYLVSLPFYGLEMFVGFVQALVFMMLSLVFFHLATAGHGEGAH